MATPPTTSKFVVCSALLDLRRRNVAGYGTEWINVGFSENTLDSLFHAIGPQAEAADFVLDRSNFATRGDGQYLSTSASLKVDPRFVRIEADGDGGFDHDYVGDLEDVYNSLGEAGIHRGFLVFDPYLVAVVPNDRVGCRSCQLKFRLIGIRSFGLAENMGSVFFQFARALGSCSLARLEASKVETVEEEKMAGGEKQKYHSKDMNVSMLIKNNTSKMRSPRNRVRDFFQQPCGSYT